MNVIRPLSSGALVVALALAMSGCAHMSARDRNTVAGAAIGGVAGSALTGGDAFGTVGGAVVGGVIGREVGTRH